MSDDKDKLDDEINTAVEGLLERLAMHYGAVGLGRRPEDQTLAAFGTLITRLTAVSAIRLAGLTGNPKDTAATALANVTLAGACQIGSMINGLPKDCIFGGIKAATVGLTIAAMTGDGHTAMSQASPR